MNDALYDNGLAFYDDLIGKLQKTYPRLMEDKIKTLPVLHALNDKTPLVQALINHDLIAGAIIKRSSALTQPHIANDLKNRLRNAGLDCILSQTTYGLPTTRLPYVPYNQKIIFADHGAYGVHLPLESYFGDKLIGKTEHTVNGDALLKTSQTPYLSTARMDLKERSDRDIAYSIAQQIIEHTTALGKNILSSRSNEVIAITGYGVMGMHAAQRLHELGCQSELVIIDRSYKKRVFAIQDGFTVAKTLKETLPRIDIGIFATNVTHNEKPVLDESDYGLLKDGSIWLSMTSMDDELHLHDILSKGILTQVGQTGYHGIYRTLSGNNIFLIENGKPPNVRLENGGVDEAMFLVEGAGIAGAFVTAEMQEKTPSKLPELPKEIISHCWLNHCSKDDHPH